MYEYYNVSQFAQGDFLGSIQALNTMSNFWLGLCLIFAFMFMSFIIFSLLGEVKSGLFACSFVGFLLALLFLPLELITTVQFYVILVLAVVTFMLCLKS